MRVLRTVAASTASGYAPYSYTYATSSSTERMPMPSPAVKPLKRGLTPEASGTIWRSLK